MKNQKKIDKNALFDNVDQFSGHEICAMVKANAYGHGIEEIVNLVQNKVSCFGVVSAQEGIRVRKLSDKPILVCAKENDFSALKKHDLSVIAGSLDDIEKAFDFGLDVCLKIDCGMNRYGVKDDEELEKINEFLIRQNVHLKMICTHFPCTDNFGKTLKSYEIFVKKRKKIEQNAKICFGGSGIVQYPFEYDMLRLGIGMFGYGEKNLKPVMKIVSHVVEIKFVQKGEFVGYGRKFRVQKAGFFAVVPVGYGDGLRRSLSGKFFVQIWETLYPSFGQVCMDAFFVRVDANVHVGDEVVVMWDAEKLANKIGTISYEILTGFSTFRGETVIE